MSTSLLYHAWGVRGYAYQRTEYVDGGIVFHFIQEDGFRCAACDSRNVLKRGLVERRFKAIPVGSKAVTLVLPVQRVFCCDCGVLRQVPLGFADERRSYTKHFERYVLELCRATTIQDAARHVGVGWDTVKDIQKRYLETHFGTPPLKHLRLLAIDEIAIGKGHRYLTVALDLESGAVVFVGEGKGAEALSPFWARLRASKARIEAVAMDMSPAYIAAVQEHLPEAQIVFDHFHVIKLFNEKLSELRRDLSQQAEAIEKKSV